MVERSKTECEIPANVRVGYVIDESYGFNAVNPNPIVVKVGDYLKVTYKKPMADRFVTERLPVTALIVGSDHEYYQIFLGA